MIKHTINASQVPMRSCFFGGVGVGRVGVEGVVADATGLAVSVGALVNVSAAERCEFGGDGVESFRDVLSSDATGVVLQNSQLNRLLLNIYFSGLTTFREVANNIVFQHH